jgi:Tfp pilus assembly protein PilX
MKRKAQRDSGFILMIIVLVLLVASMMALAFLRVQSAN